MDFSPHYDRLQEEMLKLGYSNNEMENECEKIQIQVESIYTQALIRLKTLHEMYLERIPEMKQEIQMIIIQLNEHDEKEKGIDVKDVKDVNETMGIALQYETYTIQWKRLRSVKETRIETLSSLKNQMFQIQKQLDTGMDVRTLNGYIIKS